MTKYSLLSDEQKEKRRTYARNYQRERSALIGKEERNARARSYYAANRDAIRERQRAYAALPHNKEKKRLANKKYSRESEYGRKCSLIAQARYRARVRGLPCTITKETVVWPEFCPVLGIKIDYSPKSRSRRNDASPSIDRINPALGYTKENSVVMSFRANRIKNNATAEELEKIAAFIRTKIMRPSTAAASPHTTPYMRRTDY